MNTKQHPNLLAALHKKLAFSLFYTVATGDTLTQRCEEDSHQTVPVYAAELADLTATVLMLAVLCHKHNLIDMGAIETVWAENMDKSSLCKLATVFEAVANSTMNELELPQ